MPFKDWCYSNYYNENKVSFDEIKSIEKVKYIIKKETNPLYQFYFDYDYDSDSDSETEYINFYKIFNINNKEIINYLFKNNIFNKNNFYNIIKFISNKQKYYLFEYMKKLLNKNINLENLLVYNYNHITYSNIFLANKYIFSKLYTPKDYNLIINYSIEIKNKYLFDKYIKKDKKFKINNYNFKFLKKDKKFYKYIYNYLLKNNVLNNHYYLINIAFVLNLDKDKLDFSKITNHEYNLFLRNNLNKNNIEDIIKYFDISKYKLNQLNSIKINKLGYSEIFNDYNILSMLENNNKELIIKLIKKNKILISDILTEIENKSNMTNIRKHIGLINTIIKENKLKLIYSE